MLIICTVIIVHARCVIDITVMFLHETCFTEYNVAYFCDHTMPYWWNDLLLNCDIDG